MTPVRSITAVSEALVDEWAALDPVRVGRSMGVGLDSDELTDFSPDGLDAAAELMRRTRAALEAAEPADEAERLGRLYLLEQVGAELTMLESGERARTVSALVGPPAAMRLAFDLMPRDGDDAWARVATRLERVPGAIAGYRATLAGAVGGGASVPRSTVTAVADQCATWAGSGGGWFGDFVAAHGDGPLRDRLDAAARTAAGAYGELAAWLRAEVTPSATADDGVGTERYVAWSRSMLGSSVDLDDTYAWGWDQLADLQRQQAEECERLVPGADFEAVRRLLDTDPAYAVEGVDAYRAWLQDVTDDAIARLDGVEFDIPEPLRRCEVAIPPEGSAAAPYYTPPSEDLAQPGRTWYPTQGHTRFPRWDMVTTAYHEAVPGHHLQLGATRLTPLIRAHRVGFHSAHGEGWALYAERLMDELGWFTTPDTRLGFLSAQAFRAVRVVIDIGLHTGRTIPDGRLGAGRRWTWELAVQHLVAASGLDRGFAESEILRYISWPAQATTYKLGERAWLAGRDDARAAAGAAFDRKAWHARALALGALGLDDLRRELVATVT